MDEERTTRTDRWPGLELRHLVALLAVSEQASFHGAGVSLGYTQSAVSQQIAALERIVGKKLFERPKGTRPLSLTQAGSVIARHARTVLTEIAAAQADVSALEAGRRGSLRIGTTPIAGAHVFAKVIHAVSSAYPEAEIELREETRDDGLLLALERTELDACLIDLPVPGGPFHHVEAFQEPYMLVVQAQSPLATRREPPALNELGALPLLCAASSRSSDSAVAVLRAANPRLRIAFQSDLPGTLRALVAAGRGVALVPRSSALGGIDGTAAIDVGEGLPPYRVGLVWNMTVAPTPVMAALIDLAGNAATEPQAAAGG